MYKPSRKSFVIIATEAKELTLQFLKVQREATGFAISQ
jgi:hypothetical protein